MFAEAISSALRIGVMSLRRRLRKTNRSTGDCGLPQSLQVVATGFEGGGDTQCCLAVTARDG